LYLLHEVNGCVPNNNVMHIFRSVPFAHIVIDQSLTAAGA